MLRRASALYLALACASADAAALDLALPRGAERAYAQDSALDSYALPVGPFADGALPTRIIEGRVSRQVYQIANSDLTLLQILAPVRDGLAARGYDILLECHNTECGGFDFRFATEVLPAPHMFVDLSNYRFLSAAGPDGAIGVLASQSADTRYVQIIRLQDAGEEAAIEVLAAPMQDPAPVALAPSAAPKDYATMLETQGRAVLDDLTFQTGRTALSDGPYASLEWLADYLADHPSARVMLVGHTDAEGSLDGNIAISEARAGAVRARLISRYGVSENRIEARGVGFLSPRTSNLSAEGRAENRRVEAVLLQGG